jgi:hypothetical protein
MRGSVFRRSLLVYVYAHCNGDEGLRRDRRDRSRRLRPHALVFVYAIGTEAAGEQRTSTIPQA